VLDPVDRNFDKENYGESNAMAINEQERLDRQIELVALSDKGPSHLDDLLAPATTARPPAPLYSAPAAASRTTPPTKVMNDLDDIFGPSAGGGASVTSMPTSVLPKDLSAPSGVTAEQLQQWFLRLAVNKEGVLYEDAFIQIGLKTQYDGNKGKLGLFIGNKRQDELSQFSLEMGAQCAELSCACSSAGTSIAPRQQMQLTATVECHAPCIASPPLTIRYTGGGEQRVMNLRLPVVAAKFVRPAPMNKNNFDVAWEACYHTGNSMDAPIKSVDKWMKAETLKAMLSNGLHFALVEGADAPLLAAGKLHGSSCYVKILTHESEKSVTVSVRSDHATFRESMDDLLKLLLAAAR